VVAKPAGPTSHDVVALIRRLAGVRRVGHGGTLDPFASGVLPVFLGVATRMVEYHMADGKAYRAVVCFGARSATDDLEGELTPGDGPVPERAEVEAALATFRGRIRQRPPAYSAVKVGGRRAYEIARRGGAPELREREVEIRELNLTAWEDGPRATVELSCSAGTYVRALARDLGDALGCGAYLGSLVRLASGPFSLHDAVALDDVRAAGRDGRLGELLLPADAGLEEYPALCPQTEDLVALARGQVVRLRVPAPALPGPDDLVRIVETGGRLVAMARLREGRLYPEKVLVGAG